MGAPHIKTRRHSKVHELPEDAQQALNAMLIEGATYEDIAEHFKRKGFELSRSGVGRYGKDFLNKVREVRIIEDQARTLVDQTAGDALIMEEAGSKLFAKKIIEMLLANSVSPRAIPGVLVGFSMLQRSSVAREQLKATLAKKIDKVLDKAGNKKDMTKEEMLQFIKEQVYGLA